MKIYTKTGDDGSTGLYSGLRVSKSSLRVEAYGCVDELNSVIGMAVSKGMPAEIKKDINTINHKLFRLGSDLATPLDPEPKFPVTRVGADDIKWLEENIDEYERHLEPLQNFIVPGGSEAASILQFARTVCRRAERRAVALNHEENTGLFAVKFLNRLSDYLFVAARYANKLAGIEDEKWQHDK
ncbi:MAG: cob(I)yrinic acid a,c-diamide adenosyltransferase [Candidatus Kapaibacterium sp.]